MAGTCLISNLSLDMGRPPYTAFTLNPIPMLRITCSICMANSREGTKINTCTSAHLGSNVLITGNKKDNVFPEPVGESSIVLVDFLITAIASSCIGFNSWIFNFVKISRCSLMMFAIAVNFAFSFWMIPVLRFQWSFVPNDLLIFYRPILPWSNDGIQFVPFL